MKFFKSSFDIAPKMLYISRGTQTSVEEIHFSVPGTGEEDQIYYVIISQYQRSHSCFSDPLCHYCLPTQEAPPAGREMPTHLCLRQVARQHLLRLNEPSCLVFAKATHDTLSFPVFQLWSWFSVSGSAPVSLSWHLCVPKVSTQNTVSGQHLLGYRTTWWAQWPETDRCHHSSNNSSIHIQASCFARYRS